jgi:hypothetical protein
MKVAVQSSIWGLQSDLFIENVDISVHHIASEGNVIFWTNFVSIYTLHHNSLFM